MTNFAKRSMIERDMVSSIPTTNSLRRADTQGENFDDEMEPSRPSMAGPGGESDGEEGYEEGQYGDENGEGYGDEQMSGARQSSSIGMINRQARMLAQQNYRMSGGQSRKSNSKSIYTDTPGGLPVAYRGTTTER